MTVLCAGKVQGGRCKDSGGGNRYAHGAEPPLPCFFPRVVPASAAPSARRGHSPTPAIVAGAVVLTHTLLTSGHWGAPEALHLVVLLSGHWRGRGQQRPLWRPGRLVVTHRRPQSWSQSRSETLGSREDSRVGEGGQRRVAEFKPCLACRTSGVFARLLSSLGLCCHIHQGESTPAATDCYFVADDSKHGLTGTACFLAVPAWAGYLDSLCLFLGVKPG